MSAYNPNTSISGITFGQLAAFIELVESDPAALVPAGNVSGATTFGASLGSPYTGTYRFPSIWGSVTAAATPSALAATTYDAFASTTLGAAIMGYGTTYDVTLVNRAGTAVIGIGPNTTDVTVTGPITCSGSVANPAGTVRYIGGQAGGTSNLDTNVPSGGSIRWRVAGTAMASLGANAFNIGNAGAAFNLTGTTTALTADAASGALTISSMVGTGAGTVGGMIFRVPVTHGSDSVAQSLSTAITIGATTEVKLGFYGVTAIARALLATGAGHSVDDVITALQNLGLVKQS